MSRELILPDGWFGICALSQNGVELVSTAGDPGEFRVAVNRDVVESNIFKLSINLRRNDGTDQMDEIGYLMARLNAAKTGCAFYFAIKRPDEPQSREVLYLDDTVLLSHVPIQAPNLSGGGQAPHTLTTTDGVYKLELQTSDGNLVLYKNGVAIYSIHHTDAGWLVPPKER